MNPTSIETGQTFEIERVFTQADFDRFADLSGDDNPIHGDAVFAARTRFGRPVAHGMLLYSAIQAVMGTHLPGPGSYPLRQSLTFPTPTYAGEVVRLRVEVIRAHQAAATVVLQTTVTRPGGEAGLQGEATVRLGGGGGIEYPRPDSPPEAELETDGNWNGFYLGQQAELTRTFTLEDLVEYANLAGDGNPLVTDSSYAREAGLAGPLVPGCLLGGLFSTLLGTHLPGQGTNYLKQSLSFLHPAHPGQALAANVKIVRIRAEKQLINLRTLCKDKEGIPICQGEALVLARDVLV